MREAGGGQGSASLAEEAVLVENQMKKDQASTGPEGSVLGKEVHIERHQDRKEQLVFLEPKQPKRLDSTKQN